jgi:hypothetical protein
VIVLALLVCAALVALGNGAVALAGWVALAVTLLVALPWSRRWLAAWLTPATAARVTTGESGLARVAGRHA